MNSRPANSASPVITFCIAGFQKCASTWLHRCLQEHPAVHLPDRHMLHYFDIHHQLGEDWYRRTFFPEVSASATQIGDATVSYARSPEALDRLHLHNPDLRIILLLRHPVERAWSHYWHERKKGKIHFAFGEWRENYDLFNDWIAPGLYDEAIARVEARFPAPSSLHLVLQDDVAADPVSVIKDVHSFLGIDSVEPSAGALRPRNVTQVKPPRRRGFRRFLASPDASAQEQFDAGPEPGERAALIDLFTPSVRALEARLGRDLSAWLK